MPIVNGTLTDFGLDPLTVNSPTLYFRSSSTGVAGLNILSARKAVEVTPAANGYFEADLVASAAVAPADAHYIIELRYRDAATGQMVSEVLPWKLFVPTGGGALGDLLRVPANPALVFTGTEPPELAAAGLWWLDPETGDLAEFDGAAWEHKANLRGPAGLPATGAAEDDAAVAQFIATGGTATQAAVAAAIEAALGDTPAMGGSFLDVPGVPGSVYPNMASVSGWGSSTMNGFSTALAAAVGAFGASYYNGGKGGERLDHHLAALGSDPYQLTLTGGEIPASGAVTATATNNLNFVTYNTAMRAIHGTLAGVPGTLTNDGGVLDTMTFTRSSPGAVTPVPAGSVFTPTEGTKHRNDFLILNLGKNSMMYEGAGTDQKVIEGTEAAIKWAAPLIKRVLVLGHFADTNTPAVSAIRDRIYAVNAYQRTRYGLAFIDLHEYVTGAQIWADTGIVPTQTDLDQQALGNKPPSLSADDQHLNAAAYQAVVDNLISPRLTQLGWDGTVYVEPEPEPLAGLLMEFDPDAWTSTISDGGDVTSMSPTAGTIGAAWNLKGSGATWPKLTHGIVNGHAALTFDGTAHLYNTTAPVFAADVPSTMIAVVKVNSFNGPADAQRIFSSASSGTAYRSLQAINSDSSIRAVVSNPPNASTSIGRVAPGSTLNQWMLVVVVNNGAASSNRINNSAVTAGTLEMPPQTGGTFGSSFTSTTPGSDRTLIGHIGYFAAYGRALTEQEITDEMHRLGSKYAISV